MMDTNLVLPVALALGLVFTAPPASVEPSASIGSMDVRQAAAEGTMPAPHEDIAALLEDQEDVFQLNVEACLAYTMPLLPADLRAGVAEEITETWYESDFSLSSFVTEQDPDERETLIEAMEEEVLPALEDAGMAVEAASFRKSVRNGHLRGTMQAVTCATWLTMLQIAAEAADEEAADASLPSGKRAETGGPQIAAGDRPESIATIGSEEAAVNELQAVPRRITY